MNTKKHVVFFKRYVYNAGLFVTKVYEYFDKLTLTVTLISMNKILLSHIKELTFVLQALTDYNTDFSMTKRQVN